MRSSASISVISLLLLLFLPFLGKFRPGHEIWEDFTSSCKAAIWFPEVLQFPALKSRILGYAYLSLAFRLPTLLVTHTFRNIRARVRYAYLGWSVWKIPLKWAACCYRNRRKYSFRRRRRKCKHVWLFIPQHGARSYSYIMLALRVVSVDHIWYVVTLNIY